MSRSPHHVVSALGAMAEQLNKQLARDMPNNAAARRMHEEVSRLHRSAEALDRVRASRSPLDTPEAHTKKLASMARKLDQERTASLNRVSAAVSEARADIQRRINAKVDLTAHKMGEEIRKRYFEMTPEQQSNAVIKLINDNDGPVLAALLDGPSFVTGMNEGERKAYLNGIVARHAAEEVEEQSKLEEMLNTVIVAGDTASNFTQTLTDPAALARIEDGEAAAIAAGTEFDKVLSQQ